MRWDPDHYDLYKAERQQPFKDLAALLPHKEKLSVLDLGCGTGELTLLLKNLLPKSTVVGLDSSPEMLARARLLARPGLLFEKGSIEEASGSWDLVFSNAALHWIDDHEALIPRLLAMVRPGGRFVAQIPANHDHRAHTAIRSVARRPCFQSALAGWTRTVSVLPVERYAEILFTSGTHEITALEKVYCHLMKDADSLADWLSATTVLPFLEKLPRSMRPQFLAALREELGKLWPRGPIFYGFKRILIAASRRQQRP